MTIQGHQKTYPEGKWYLGGILWIAMRIQVKMKYKVPI